MTTKTQLAEKIKRRLGYPMVKIELDYSQLTDSIDYARDKWIKWSAGNATSEVFFTTPLSAGQYLYDMPTGCVEVLSYDAMGISSGINTLFTVENYLYSNGMFESLLNTSAAGYSLVSYHAARDFLDTLKRYTPDAYNFKYHRYTNQLEIQPPPPSGGSLTYTPKYLNAQGEEVVGQEITIDSPGFMLIRAYMVEGSTLDPDYANGDTDPHFLTSSWIFDYATAYATRVLGLVRRKFGQFSSLGNQGISMDGDSLISEANDQMERLMEDLYLREVYEGYGIEIG